MDPPPRAAAADRPSRGGERRRSRDVHRGDGGAAGHRPAIFGAALAGLVAGGVLEARFDVVERRGQPDDPPAPGITVHRGGSLSDTPKGACVADLIDRAIAAADTPTKVQTGTAFAKFEVP